MPFYPFQVRNCSISVHSFQCTDCHNTLETITLSKRRQRYTLTYLHWYIFGKHWFFSLCLEQKWNLHVCICLTKVTSTCTVSWHFHVSLSACYHHLTDSCITLGIVIAFQMCQHNRQRTRLSEYSTETVILGMLISHYSNSDILGKGDLKTTKQQKITVAEPDLISDVLLLNNVSCQTVCLLATWQSK